MRNPNNHSEIANPAPAPTHLPGSRIDLSYAGKQQVSMARLKVSRQKNLVMRLRALGRNTEQDERLLLSLEEALIKLTCQREQELRGLYRQG